VSSANPEDGSIMIPVNTSITFTFSKEMGLSSVSTLTTVTDGHDNAVQGSWSGSGGTYTFTPKIALDNLTMYHVSMKGAFSPAGEWLGPGVSDVNGNSLEHETSISFSTEGIYGHYPLYLGSGGDNGGILAYVQDFTLSEFEHYPGEGVQTPAITPDGAHLYVASSENSFVYVIDVVSNTLSAEIAMPDSVVGPRTLAVTPNGSEVWVACNKSMDVVVINTSTNQIDAVFSLEDYAEDVHSIAINNAGTMGYITTNWDQGVIVVDIPNRNVVEYIEHVATVESTVQLTVSPDDSKIIVFLAWAEDEIAVIDVATHAIEYHTLGSHGDGWMIDVDEHYIYANGRSSGNIYKIDMNDMSVAAETNVGWEMKGIAVDHDGEVVYTTSPNYHDEGAILILTSSDLSLIGTIHGGNYRHIVTP
jgi:YVTN family beta-propeller protein